MSLVGVALAAPRRSPPLLFAIAPARTNISARDIYHFTRNVILLAICALLWACDMPPVTTTTPEEKKE